MTRQDIGKALETIGEKGLAALEEGACDAVALAGAPFCHFLFNNPIANFVNSEIMSLPLIGSMLKVAVSRPCRHTRIMTACVRVTRVITMLNLVVGVHATCLRGAAALTSCVHALHSVRCCSMLRRQINACMAIVNAIPILKDVIKAICNLHNLFKPVLSAVYNAAKSIFNFFFGWL